MNARTMWLGLAAVSVLSGTAGVSGQTPISEVVMYGIDADTWALVRYAFETDTFVSVGIVKDQNGAIVTDCEALTCIPAGPHEGLYAGANFYEATPSRLVKVNGIDPGNSYKYPVNVGFNKIEGMTAVQDWGGIPGWSILAVTKHHNPGDGDHCLLRIDPATGIGTLIMPTNERYDGLALSPPGTPAGTIYGWARDDGVWIINPVAGTETRLPGNAPFDRVDTLEWAWGDSLPAIDCTPVAPAAWTANGVLFGFDDDSNALLILDPATGNAVTYPCSFTTVDCEGLAFTTQLRDPYGEIVVDAHD
jgi:hypothetical protein